MLMPKVLIVEDQPAVAKALRMLFVVNVLVEETAWTSEGALISV